MNSQAIWLLAGNAVEAAVKWGMFIAAIRLLDVEEAGFYALGLAVAAPITLFSNMKLRSLYVTDGEQRFPLYRKVRTRFSLLVMGALFLIGGLCYSEIWFLLMLIGLSKVLELQSDLYYAVPHRIGDLAIIGKRMIQRNLLAGGAFVTALWSTGSLALSLAVQVLVQTVWVYVAERPLSSGMDSSEDRSNWRILLASALPLGVVQVVQSIYANMPRYAVENMMDAEALAVLSAVFYVTTAAALFMNGVSNAVLPALAKSLSKQDLHAFRRLFHRRLGVMVLLAGIILVLVSWGYGGTILGILYGQAFKNFGPLLTLMAIGSAVGMIGWNYETALMAAGEVRIQPKLAIILLIVSVPVLWLSVGSWGLEGAAWAFVGLSVLQAAMRGAVLHRVLRIRDGQAWIGGGTE